MYISKYRESLKRESISTIMSELLEILELEEEYSEDFYISREIELANEMISNLEDVIEYIINFKYSINQL